MRAAWAEVRLAVDEVVDQHVRRRALQALDTGCLAGTPDNVQWDALNAAALEKLADTKEMVATRDAIAAGASVSAANLGLDSDEEMEAMSQISFERSHAEAVPGSVASLAAPPPMSAAVQELCAVAALIARLRRAVQEQDWAGMRRLANEARK